MRTAVIDIGTNTLLLLVVERAAGGPMRPVVDLCRFGRLGKGLDASGRLGEEAIAKSLEICREYRKVMDEQRVERTTIIGTQALREAKNAADFVEPAQQILGAQIEIIAGQREADLAFAAVQHTFEALAGQPYIVVDVGGGSTELIATDGTKVTSATSVPIGAVRLHERHLKTDPPTAAEMAALAADIDAHLAKLSLPRNVTIVGTAGTATTMASIHLGLEHYDPDAVTGLRLSPEAAAAQLSKLAALPTAERKKLHGLPPERADVIVAGVAIYARILHQLGAPVIITCDRGIRWGVAYTQ